MSLIQLPNGAVARSSRGRVFVRTEGTTDLVPTVAGPPRVEDGAFVVTIRLPEPPDGFVWRLSLPTELPQTAQPGEQNVTIGQLTTPRADLSAWLYNPTTRAHRRPVQLSLAWPIDVELPAAPAIIGALPPVSASIGDVVTVSAGAAFSGEGLLFVARFDDTTLTDGWTFNVATGVLTVPTTAPVSKVLVVTASNVAGSASISFPVVVALTPMVNTVAPTFTGANVSNGTVWTATPGTWTGGHAPFTTTYAFETNGTPGAFSSTATRAIDAASDAGRTITALVRRVDAFGQETTLRAQGSAVVLGGEPPTVVGSIPNVDVVQGASVTRTAAGVFSAPSPLTYAMRFKVLGGLTAGWAINATTGAITIPTDTVIGGGGRVLVVTATNTSNGATAEAEFSVVVRAVMSYAETPVFAPDNPPGLVVGATWDASIPPIVNGTPPYEHRVEYLRNGSSIGGFVTTKHTVSEADRGATVTARRRTLDAAGQIVTVTATGSLLLPVGGEVTPELLTPNATVSNSLQLSNALQAVPANLASTYVIRLNGGVYGSFTAPANYQRGTTGRVVLQGASRADPPIFRLLAFVGARRVSLLGLSVVSATDDGYGFPDGTGLDIENSQDCVVRNCLVDRFHSNIRANNSVRLAFEYVSSKRCGMDDVRLYGRCADITFKGFASIQPDIDERRSDQWGYQGNTPVADSLGQIVTWGETTPNGGKTARHPDAIQTNDPCTNIVIDDCLFDCWNGYKQALLFNNRAVRTNAADRHTGIVIRRTMVNCGNVNGITIEGAQGLDVQDLVLRTWPAVDWARHAAIKRYPWVQTGLLGDNRDDRPNLMYPALNLTRYAAGTLNRVILPTEGNGSAFYTDGVAGGNPQAIPGTVTQTAVSRSTTALPAGWASMDVALGRVGQWGLYL